MGNGTWNKLSKAGGIKHGTNHRCTGTDSFLWHKEKTAAPIYFNHHPTTLNKAFCLLPSCQRRLTDCPASVCKEKGRTKNVNRKKVWGVSQSQPCQTSAPTTRKLLLVVHILAHGSVLLNCHHHFPPPTTTTPSQFQPLTSCTSCYLVSV